MIRRLICVFFFCILRLIANCEIVNRGLGKKKKGIRGLILRFCSLGLILNCEVVSRERRRKGLEIGFAFFAF